ncbi:MAG: cytochrome c5 family protein [Granulosicoccus sp.]
MLIPPGQMVCIWLIFISVNVSVPVLADDVTKYPILSPELNDGRTVWLGNCETCHAYGTAGAPNPRKPKQWEHRLKRPRLVLYQHAIEGFYGENDTYMPARGGNPDLSDEQVKTAVDYMLALARFYMTQRKI